MEQVLGLVGGSHALHAANHAQLLIAGIPKTFQLPGFLMPVVGTKWVPRAHATMGAVPCEKHDTHWAPCYPGTATDTLLDIVLGDELLIRTTAAVRQPISPQDPSWPAADLPCCLKCGI